MRLEGGVLHGGVHHSNLGVPRAMVGCVTRGMGRDMHRLRNVVGSLLTRSVVFGHSISLSLTREVMQGTMHYYRDGPIAMRSVVRGMYDRCRVRRSTVRAGAEGERIMRMHRMTVCLTGGRASSSSSGVNRLVNGGSRTAMLRTYGVMGSRMRISGTFGTSVRRVRTSLGEG